VGAIAEAIVAYAQPLLDQTDGAVDQMNRAKFQFKANIQNARCRVFADEEAPRNESQCALSVREWAQIQAMLRRRALISKAITLAASGCER
jgi:hypothetical protein